MSIHTVRGTFRDTFPNDVPSHIEEVREAYDKAYQLLGEHDRLIGFLKTQDGDTCNVTLLNHRLDDILELVYSALHALCNNKFSFRQRAQVYDTILGLVFNAARFDPRFATAFKGLAEIFLNGEYDRIAADDNGDWREVPGAWPDSMLDTNRIEEMIAKNRADIAKNKEPSKDEGTTSQDSSYEYNNPSEHHDSSEHNNPSEYRDSSEHNNPSEYRDSSEAFDSNKEI